MDNDFINVKGNDVEITLYDKNYKLKVNIDDKKLNDGIIDDIINCRPPYDKYVIGNGVLYDLCKEYSKHDNADEISSKMWLIGRSYAASPERIKKNDKKEHDKKKK